jgi:hypothetical protein
VQDPSKAQMFLTLSQNQKIFKTDFCLNVEFEHRVNDLMTYIWKKKFEFPMNELSEHENSFKIAKIFHFIL